MLSHCWENAQNLFAAPSTCRVAYLCITYHWLIFCVVYFYLEVSASTQCIYTVSYSVRIIRTCKRLMRASYKSVFSTWFLAGMSTTVEATLQVTLAVVVSWTRFDTYPEIVCVNSWTPARFTCLIQSVDIGPSHWRTNQPQIADFAPPLCNPSKIWFESMQVGWPLVA